MNQDNPDPRPMFYGALPVTFDKARSLRENQTESEKLTWVILKKHFPKFKFRRQHPAGLFILDFYCHKLKLAIEVDGGYHHGLAQQLADMERERIIANWGVMVVRVTNREVDDQNEAVIKIQTAIALAASGLNSL
jgi:very-short-patch-repair endonuclease